MMAVMHTPDYFVIHKDSAGWQECKHERELEKLALKSPNRYSRMEDGRWRCPPGEAHGTRFGLYYRLRSSSEIDWTLQRNIQYLDDYWRFDAVGVASETREIIAIEVSAAPGLRLSDLYRNTQGLASRDDVHRLIAAGDIYVDLRAAGIMEPDKARAFPNREAALAFRHIEDHLAFRGRQRFVQLAPGAGITLDGKSASIVDCCEKTVFLGGPDCVVAEVPIETFEAFVKDGRVAPTGVELPGTKTSSALTAAREDDLRIANKRFEIVQRHLKGESALDGTSVPERTLRLWTASYRRAEAECGSGYLGLIPRTSQRGNRGNKLPEESRTLLDAYIEQNYETFKQKSKLTVWAAQRKGRRAAYTHEPFYWELEPTTPRHGDRPFEIGHIDHTELDVELVCSHTGRLLGRPWMTLLTDAFSRRSLALGLAFDPPSYRSCMVILRDCVRRHGRLPQIIVIDGGPEFQGTYFEALLARYQCIKKTRPPAKARFGSCCERFFGTTNTRFIHNLQGNTQITRNVRQVTKSVDPRELATWTLVELHTRLSEYLFEVYDTIDHPALGRSPREAFQAGFEASGIRTERMIPYDQEFLMATLPSTPKGTAKVTPGRGIKINRVYYWSGSFQSPAVENQQVPIRYDPFDAGTAYAFIERRWVQCHSEYYAGLHGHSEKEIMIASHELRRRHQLHSQGFVITAKKLADFLQSVEADELLLAQRLRDQEAQGTRGSVTAAPSMAPLPVGVDGERVEEKAVTVNAGTADNGEIYGEF
jgi:putative transposase